MGPQSLQQLLELSLEGDTCHKPTPMYTGVCRGEPWEGGVHEDCSASQAFINDNVPEKQVEEAGISLACGFSCGGLVLSHCA